MDPVGDTTKEENTNEKASPSKVLNQEDTEAYAEALELQGFHDTKDIFSPDSLVAFTATETSCSTSSDDEDEDEDEVKAYIEYPVRTSIRPRIASFEPTTTATDSWNEEDKKNRAIVLQRFSKPKQSPIRRSGVLELARIEHERRLDIMNQEWALKKRILEMKLRTAEMKYEAAKWRTEYLEVATKRKFYFNHYHDSKGNYGDHHYDDNGHP